VQKHRGTLSEVEHDKAQEQRPVHPEFAVYADESGKTGRFLLVGSLWFLHVPQFLPFVLSFDEFKASHGYERKEFHFKEVNYGNLAVYKRFSEWLVERSSVVSFKAVSVERAGLKSVPQALETLFYHLIVRGVEREHSSGRAKLPRTVAIWKDLEETGSDKVFLAELGDRLRTASTVRFNGKLQIDVLEAVDSKENPLMQAADLYTGCLNRILNSDGGKEHPKDILASHFLQLLGLPNGPQDKESEGGLAIHVGL
jgi:Protein of unknown function (DUF3800)